MADALRKKTSSDFVDARDQYTKNVNRRGFAANLNHDPQYPTISGDFVKQQQNRLGWGVQNVKTELGSEKSGNESTFVGKKTYRFGKKLERAGKRLQYAPGAPGKVGKIAKYAGNYIKRNGFGTPKDKNASKTDKIVGKALAKTQVTFAMGWTGLLNIISLPVGILALAAFGGASLVADTTGGEIVTQIAIWMMGLEYFNIWVLAIGLYVFHAFLIITMFAGSYMQLKIGGLEPLDGRASVAKNLLFISAFVLSAIPGTTFIPWIFGWLLLIMLYPN